MDVQHINNLSRAFQLILVVSISLCSRASLRAEQESPLVQNKTQEAIFTRAIKSVGSGNFVRPGQQFEQKIKQLVGNLEKDAPEPAKTIKLDALTPVAMLVIKSLAMRKQNMLNTDSLGE